MRILRPYTAENQPLPFQTYDLEWNPDNLALRLAGVYDGKHYRHYTTAENFIDAELTATTRGTVYFAHAGGLFDVQYILEAVVRRRPDMMVSAAMAGSSAIIVKVKDTSGHCWTFCDSFWLMHDSLRNIAKSLGDKKGGGDDYTCSTPCKHAPGTCMFYASLPILRDYNEQDCRLLYNAIRRLESELLELGGSLRFTIASTAMRLFRSAFLKEDIHINMSVNENAREAYIASRVEVFRPHSKAGWAFDVNSSFPRSMLEPLPGNLKQVTKRLPDSGLYLARASVCVPPSYVPPLPYRHNGRIYFPSGVWEAWFTNVDLEFLQECRGKILSVSHVNIFESTDVLAAYVSEIYERRRKTEDPFRKLVYKYLLNSLYGKFAEQEEKERLMIRPHSTKGLRMLSPGIFVEKQSRPISHAHVPIAAHITANSRRILSRYMLQALELGGRIYYCDTDSVFTDIRLPTSDKLGELKEEKTYKRAIFVAPKLYAVDERVKAKGFTKLAFAEFERMVSEVWDGVPFPERSAHLIRRMLRLKELYGKGKITPQEVNVEKRLALLDRPKRQVMKNGDSIPWTVREIESTEWKRSH